MTKEFWQAVDMEDHWEIWDSDCRTRAITAYEGDAKMILRALIKMEEDR